MRLKSLTLNGFKSFPQRTRLDFADGVSVVVGPNGSGKSNVTDAVLWAMGEQSPLAVRGQSMQDVIFGGGRGVQARSAAEVEIVLDNSDGTVDLPLSEISIVRRLDRNGEGGYRLNGARCRLTDVIELLSDTGLGKETHSVISQGRVDAIVNSKPRERRLLIEEAAGLGKHRKRRRRAQLKLDRTQENLDRALDIEREARTRLRPLKRQAEAAELHERLERQILESRWQLVGDAARARGLELTAAEGLAAQARGAREQVEARLQATIDARGIAERALAERAERHDALARRVYDARSSRDRLALRAEQTASCVQTLRRRIERVAAELAELEPLASGSLGEDGEELPEQDGRVRELEAQLAELASVRERELDEQLAQLRAEHERQLALVGTVGEECERAARQAAAALASCGQARSEHAQAERSAQEARREAERVGAELAAANQFLRAHAGGFGGQAGAPKALSEELRVSDGFELALAAALGGRLDAAVVADVAGAEALLDGAGPDGGAALLSGPGGDGERPVERSTPPVAGAVRLLDELSGAPQVLALARRLLADAWVVERLEDLPVDFAGVAATRSGRVWFGSWGEVRQLSEGGTERVLARRNERDRLIEAAELAASAERDARGVLERALEQVRAGEAAQTEADGAVREVQRRLADAEEASRHGGWLIEQRRSAPAEGPVAVRKAELEGALAAERRLREQLLRERRLRAERVRALRAQQLADNEMVPRGERLASALGAAHAAVQERLQALERELAEDRLAGEEMAAKLTACAAEEAAIQAELRAAGEGVTAAEVGAQRLRDQAAETELELRALAERLGIAAPQPIAAAGEAVPEAAGEDGEQTPPAPEPLVEEEVQALESRVQRLTRRREQLGPVNPLAQEEYTEALAHVEELESQRSDLETALRELRGVIRDTDRQIEETFAATFAAASRNFEQLVEDVFPGGSGRLRLVEEEQGQRPVLGGQPLPDGEAGESSEEAAEAEADAELERREDGDAADRQGVEIEITPAGKATKRLSLLSGGEKSMTALAFLFAVFLARPCPFYILDEVEAALDDLNLDRFLALLRRYADRAQFIVITHQKRTMEAADALYGVSMGGDGVSKVLSRRLPAETVREAQVA